MVRKFLFWRETEHSYFRRFAETLKISSGENRFSKSRPFVGEQKRTLFGGLQKCLEQLYQQQNDS